MARQKQASETVTHIDQKDQEEIGDLEDEDSSDDSCADRSSDELRSLGKSMEDQKKWEEAVRYHEWALRNK